MPYERWGCSVCGKQASKNLREHGNMSERMRWLWSHRKKEHPWHHSRSVAKSQRSRGIKK